MLLPNVRNYLPVNAASETLWSHQLLYFVSLIFKSWLGEMLLMTGIRCDFGYVYQVNSGVVLYNGP